MLFNTNNFVPVKNKMHYKDWLIKQLSNLDLYSLIIYSLYIISTFTCASEPSIGLSIVLMLISVVLKLKAGISGDIFNQVFSIISKSLNKNNCWSLKTVKVLQYCLTVIFNYLLDV